MKRETGGWRIPLQTAAVRLCERCGSTVERGALDAAAEALARLLAVYEARNGRLLEIPAEERVLGVFEGGAARLRGASGKIYRRGLCVRPAELERALAAVNEEPSAVAPLPEEIDAVGHGPRG